MIMSHPLDSTLGPMAPFVCQLLTEMQAVMGGSAFPVVDHLCYRAATLPEYLDLLAEDLDAMELKGALLVDGGLCTPGLLAQVLPARQIACLAAPDLSSEQIWEGTAERAAMKDAMAHLPDPAAAWRTFLEFDTRITQTILAECRQSGISIYQRHNATSVDELAEHIAGDLAKL